MGVAALIASIVAFASIELRLNQIAVGFVLFLLAIELSGFLGDPYVGRQGRGVPSMPIPLLSDIPFLGTVLFEHNLSVYGSYLVIVGAYLFIFRTRRGLEMQGVGERPEAAFARGIPVNRLRYLYTIVGGALVGIGRCGLLARRPAGMARRAHQELRVDRSGHRDLRWVEPDPRRHRLLPVRRAPVGGAASCSPCSPTSRRSCR